MRRAARRHRARDALAASSQTAAGRAQAAAIIPPFFPSGVRSDHLLRIRPGRAGGGDAGFIGFLPIILMFVLLYFLMIRPQMKRAKETKAMIEALQKGDEVVTAGGMVGTHRQARRPVREPRDRAQHRDQRAEGRGADAAAQGHDEEPPVDAMNRYPAWKYALIALVIAGRVPLHGAELLRRVARGAGLERASHGQGRRRRCMARVEEMLKKADIALHRRAARRRPACACASPTPTRSSRRATCSTARSTRIAPTRPTSWRSTCCPPRRNWLTAIHALPMYLGLDLRGGVHFLLQVDMQAAMHQAHREPRRRRAQPAAREEASATAASTREGQTHPRALPRRRDARRRRAARCSRNMPDLAIAERDDGQDLLLVGHAQARGDQARRRTRRCSRTSPRCTTASTSSAWPSRSSSSRAPTASWCSCPACRTPARAKEILGRTATLEVRMVAEEHDERRQHLAAATRPGAVRHRVLRRAQRRSRCWCKSRWCSPATSSPTRSRASTARPTSRRCTCDSTAGRRASCARPRARTSKQAHGDHAVREGQGRGDHRAGDPAARFGGRFQITGAHEHRRRRTTWRCCCAPARSPRRWRSSRSAPSARASGATTSRRASTPRCGASSPSWCSCRCTTSLFGVISSVALGVNLLLLVALLSLLQATLTLPGIAAIALTLGMAIDANVLINERIREELRGGATPQAAIAAGYERAWGTILDSNVTTLHRGPRAADLRPGPGARLRGGALPGHPHLDVLGGGGVARDGQPGLRPPPPRRQARRSATPHGSES